MEKIVKSGEMLIVETPESETRWRRFWEVTCDECVTPLKAFLSINHDRKVPFSDHSDGGSNE
jgi:hypothetical protein